MLNNEYSFEEIAEVLIVDEDSIRRWHNLYLEGGIESLSTNSYKGSDPFLRFGSTNQSCTVYGWAYFSQAALVSHGVTANDLKTLQTRIDAFAGILASPRTAITERKDATDEIGKLLRKVDGILTNKLDKLVEKFKVPSPEFYKLFFDARKIVNIGTHHEDSGETPVKPAA